MKIKSGFRMRNHIQIELQLQPNPDFCAQLWQRTYLQQSLPAAAGAMSNAAVSAEALPDAEEQALHRRKKSYCHKFVRSIQNDLKVPPDFSDDKGGRVLRTNIFKSLLSEAISIHRNVIYDSKKHDTTPDEESQSI